MAAVVDACPTCGEAACGTRRGFCKPRRNQPWQLNGGGLSTSRGPEYAAAGVVASCRRKGQSGRCTSPNVLVMCLTCFTMLQQCVFSLEDDIQVCETAQTVDLALPSLAIPSVSARATSMHPLILGGSPGSTGTMSLYFALKQLGVSTVHYSRMFNATTGEETTSYGLQPPGGPVPFLRRLFTPTHPAPPVDADAAREIDLTFLRDTDALIDTPSMELFFELLAAFPNAKVILTARDPASWAKSRQARHPTDATPLLHALNVRAPIGAVSATQAASALALWHRVVLGSLPPSRVLVLDVFAMDARTLWTRLAAFVRRPLPTDEHGALPPFPHMHYGEDVGG